LNGEPYPYGAQGKAAVIEANELEAWGDEAVNSANTRIPYHSTMLQTTGAGDIVGETGPYGAQGKAAIIEANELEAWGDEAVNSANTRIPYHSTMVQLQDPRGAEGKAAIVEANELEAWGDEAVDSANGRIPYHSTLTQLDDPRGAEGKAAIVEANELEAWGDEAVDSANKRIPYHSTLLQTRGAGDIIGEKGPYGAQGKAAIIEANELEAWGDEAVDSANGRIPYHSTLLQTRGAGDIVGEKGVYGAQGKAAIVEANELEAWGDEAVDSANGRIPYHSTLLQTKDVKGAEGKSAIIEANELEAWGDEAVDSANLIIPYHSTLLQTRGAGDIFGEKGVYGAQGKAAIVEANELEAWGDEAVDSANGRIPYHSTLLQQKVEEAKAYGAEGKAAIIEANELEGWGDEAVDSANQRIPYHSTLLMTHGAGDIVGEKGVYGVQGKAAIVEANELEAWGDEAVTSANTRIPYHSTLVQLNDLDDDSDDGEPEKIELEAANAIPRDYKLVAVKGEEEGDELIKIETLHGVPLDFKFMQDDSEIETLEHDDVGVPLNFRFVNVPTEFGNVVKMNTIF